MYLFHFSINVVTLLCCRCRWWSVFWLTMPLWKIENIMRHLRMGKDALPGSDGSSR